MTPSSATCFFCDTPARDNCPRCEQPRCAQHGRGDEDSSWPRVGYQKPDLCPTCMQAEERRSRKAGRVAVASGAAIVGMAASAFMVMLLGSALGFGAQLTVLCMLLAELSMGALSAYTADKHVRRWLLERDQRQLKSTLPEARLLER